MILREDNITGNVLKHMIHSEDLILTGREGSLLLLKTFRDIFNALKGNSPTSRITQKIDGAPAVIAASDFHGKKFVALKHSWDKGKIFQSVEEIRKNFSDRPDLCAKLEYLFNSLDAIQIPKDEIWHGDFLYHKSDLKTDIIENKKYIVFRPNTIVYAIPVSDPLAKTIVDSTIGVAWHTKYTGSSFDDIHISFDVSVSSVNEIPEVYQMDARIPSLAGRVTMTAEETEKAETTLDSLDLIVHGITVDDGYEELTSDELLVLLLNTYRNFIIKESNRQFPDIQGLKAWVSDRYDKEKDKKKTDKGKSAVEDRKQAILSVIDKNNDLILRIYEAQEFATTLKEMFITKLNSLSSMKSFVSHVSQGYISTSGEGFAVSDVDGNVYKLVSRLEFSRNNFSKEIIKGWQSEKRMNENVKVRKSAIKRFKEDIESIEDEDINKDLSDIDFSSNEDNIDVNSDNKSQEVIQKVDKKQLKKDTAEKNLNDAKALFNQEINSKIGAEFKPLAANDHKGIKATPRKPDSDYMVHLQPVEKVYRDTLRNNLLDFGKKNPDIDIQGTPKDGTTPTAKVVLEDENNEELIFDIRFKNNGRVGMTAEQTRNMEEIWAECICREFENRYWGTAESDKVSFDDLIDEDFLESKGLNSDWKEAIRQGTYAIVNRFSNDGKNVYYVFREDKCFLPKSQRQTGIESLHTKIDSIVGKRCVFPPRTKKDTWNPSDIYICEVQSYDDFVKEWDAIYNNLRGDGESNLPQEVLDENRSNFNALLRKYITDGKVVGISLKKITDDSRPRIEDINVKEDWVKHIFEIDGDIKIPKFCLASERGDSFKLGGVHFEVNEVGGENRRIKYDFRRFTKSNSMSLELEYVGDAARIGKTPKALVGEGEPEDDESEQDLESENAKNTETLSNEKTDSLMSELLKLRNKVSILETSSLNTGNHMIKTGDKKLSLAEWDNFINRIRTIGIDNIKDPVDKNKLLDWPKIITFLYVLSTDVPEMLEKWYSGALKYGEFFAPYIKIS